MTNWQAEIKWLGVMIDQIAEQLVRFRPNFKMPRYRYDGSPVVNARDIVNATGIPFAEAEKRLAIKAAQYAGGVENKDVHTNSAETAIPVGVGTVVGRATAMASRRRKKRKKREA